MAELPRGTMLETRRGGPDVLRTLVKDFFSDSQDGYIRIERLPKERLPRIGQLIISNGEPLSAIHEQEAINLGVDALIEIEEDAMHIDSILTIIGDVDIAHIDSQFPDARLNIETVWTGKLPESVGERWWLTREVREATWSKATEHILPEYENVVEAPEFIQRAAALRRAKMKGELCGELTPGQVLLLDARDNHNSFRLAAELALLGRPVLILSRLPKERLVVEFGLPSDSCWWLTERPGGIDRACGARLEDITRTINDFLWGNLRAIVVLDGLEFLASVHGVERTFSFIRRLADTFHDSDDALMIPVDLLAWEEKERHLLTREAETVGSAQVAFWLEDSDALATHPLCAPPSDEEVAWIEAALQTAENVRQAAQSSDESEVAIGAANRFSAGEFAQEWLREGSIASEVASDDGADEDWVPTFRSAQSGAAITAEVLAEIDAEEGDSKEDLTSTGERVEQELAIPPQPRRPHRLGKRREIRVTAAKELAGHEHRRNELGAAAASAGEVDETTLERKSSLLDDRLAKAKKALQAIGVASSKASVRIAGKTLPVSGKDVERNRSLGEWHQAVVAGKGNRLARLPEPEDAPNSWSAAVDNVRHPLHADEEASATALSPLISRPGVEVKTSDKGRDSAQRTQKDMSMTAVARRIARVDEKLFTTGKIVTDLNKLEGA
ncbi:MAG TPA: DUF835 domain-containing protein [Candidatus Poseidoniales archaeon]|nr:DUF835 domain-containing protein [Candidatus Poseidoniales archaeon]HIB59142.1 DUF835 domain-containing protein [Candidatus Poseidoniales archaeon]